MSLSQNPVFTPLVNQSAQTTVRLPLPMVEKARDDRETRLRRMDALPERSRVKMKFLAARISAVGKKMPDEKNHC